MKPFVHLNSAMTVDGKIATSNSSLQISGKNDLIRVHKLRKKYDAIMVGIGTVLVDDPRLTVHKIESHAEDNPVRIVVDSKARTPRNARVLSDDAETIVFVSKKASQEKVSQLKDKCVVICCGDDEVNLKEAMNILFKRGISSILLEGGSTLNFSMFKGGLIDEVSVCVGSKILGGSDSKTFVDGEGFNKSECVGLELKNIEKIDNDVVLTYNAVY